MATVVEPWILKKVTNKFGGAEEVRRSGRNAKPYAQFIEALRPQNPLLPAGNQCILNDKDHSIYGVITDQAVDLLKEDEESGIQLPFSVPKLKGYLLKLLELELQTYICPGNVEKSGFVVVVHRVRVITNEKQSAIGDPKWIEEEQSAKSMLTGVWRSACETEQLVNAGTKVLASLDTGHSQAPIAAGWNADPEQLLSALSFTVHPEEREKLSSIQPPDVPCSLPRLCSQEDGLELEDVAELFTPLQCSGRQPAAAAAASVSHFSPRRGQTSQHSECDLSSLPSPVSCTLTARRALRSAGLASAAPTVAGPPLRPGCAVDPCLSSRQIPMDMGVSSSCSATQSSGSSAVSASTRASVTAPAAACLDTAAACLDTVVIDLSEANTQEPQDDTECHSDASAHSSAYETASEKRSPPSPTSHLPSVRHLDSPSINLHRPPRRKARKRGGGGINSAATARDKLAASEVQLEVAFENEAALQMQRLDPESCSSDSGAELVVDDSPTVGSRKRKMSSPRKCTTQGEATADNGDGPSSKLSGSSPPLFSSGNSSDVRHQGMAGVTASGQSSGSVAAAVPVADGGVAAPDSNNLNDSNPFDTQHVTAMHEEESMDYAECSGRYPASMEFVTTEVDLASQAASQPVPRRPAEEQHSEVSQEDLPDSNPFADLGLASQYAGDGRETFPPPLAVNCQDSSSSVGRKGQAGCASSPIVVSSGTSTDKSFEIPLPLTSPAAPHASQSGGTVPDTQTVDVNVLVRETSLYIQMAQEPSRPPGPRTAEEQQQLEQAIEEALEKVTRSWCP